MRPIHRATGERWRAGVEITCCWFDQDVLEIRVSASNGAFSGVAHPYIAHDALHGAAAILGRFPETTADRRELRFGATGEEFAGGFVALDFSCRDSSGHSVVEVKLESKNDSRSEPQWNIRPQTVHFLAAVEAAAVDQFVKELAQLGATKAGSAWLQFRRD